MPDFLSKNSDFRGLSEQLHAALSQRLSTNPELREEEVGEISSLNHRFFPTGFALTKEDTERLRSLCRLSRAEIQRPSEISSHRAFIGPLIVFVKRLAWPFLRAQLKGTLEAQEEFNLIAVESLAAVIARTEQAESS